MYVTFETYRFDSVARHLLREKESIHLTPLSCRLLEILVAQRPAALSKAELHERLWPAAHVEEANLANLVSDLRKAFGSQGRTIIRTVHRFGYAFGVEARLIAAHELDSCYYDESTGHFVPDRRKRDTTP